MAVRPANHFIVLHGDGRIEHVQVRPSHRLLVEQKWPEERSRPGIESLMFLLHAASDATEVPFDAWLKDVDDWDVDETAETARAKRFEDGDGDPPSGPPPADTSLL